MRELKVFKISPDVIEDCLSECLEKSDVNKKTRKKVGSAVKNR